MMIIYIYICIGWNKSDKKIQMPANVGMLLTTEVVEKRGKQLKKKVKSISGYQGNQVHLNVRVSMKCVDRREKKKAYICTVGFEVSFY